MVAALVRLKDDLSRRHRAVVGDVEEVANLVEESELAAFDRDVLPQRDDTVGALALAGLIVEFHHLLGVELEVLVAALFDDALLDVLGPEARLGFDLTLDPACKLLVQALWLGFGPVYHRLRGIHSKDEVDAIIVPAVEVSRQ